MAESSGEVATEYDDLLSKEEVAKLKEKYGEITAVSTKKGVAVFRSPNRGEFALYSARLMDEKSRAKAFELLAGMCVVKPDRATFEGWLDSSPGISQTCLTALLELAGVDNEAKTKKY